MFHFTSIFTHITIKRLSSAYTDHLSGEGRKVLNEITGKSKLSHSLVTSKIYSYVRTYLVLCSVKPSTIWSIRTLVYFCRAWNYEACNMSVSIRLGVQFFVLLKVYISTQILAKLAKARWKPKTLQRRVKQPLRKTFGELF